MPYPAAVVEISFVSTIYDANPTWVDVTSYVRELTTRRGRSDPFQDFGSGTATVTLDNRDRRFDPLNTAGPYYGNLTPRKQIRIRATNTVAGIPFTFDVFRGYVSGWPVTMTEAGFDSTVTLECFDALGLLASEEIPEDLADAYIRSLNPVNYWPLTDPIDPDNLANTQLTDYGSQPHPLVAAAGINTANGEGLAEGLPDSSLLVANTNATNAWSAITATTGAPGTNTAHTLCFWYRQTNTTGNTVLLFYGPQPSLQVEYNQGTNTLTVRASDQVNQRDYTYNVFLDATIPHHIAIRYFQSFTSFQVTDVFVDGVKYSSVSSSFGAVTLPNGVKLYSYAGLKQHVAKFAGLTDAQILTIYRLSRNILTETTAARFDRLIAYTPFPTSFTSAPTSSTTTVGAFTTGGPTVANELEIVSDSEGGNLYVTKSGVITMTARNEIGKGKSATSQATIGTTGITIGPVLDYRIDAELMRNEIVTSYSGDGSVKISDSSSITSHGVIGGTVDTQLTSADAAEELAQFIVGFTKNPAVTISPVEVNVSASATDWSTVLNLELLERYTLTVQPKSGAAFTLPQLIQSIEHRVIPGQWNTTLIGSVLYTNTFIIGSSLLGGSDLLT